MQGDTPRHEEFTPLALWARALTWGAVALGLRAVFVNPPGEGVFPSFVAAGILSIGILVEVVFGGLRVRLYTDRVQLSLGRVGWIRKTIRYEAIESIEPVTYRPLKEFGGWGVRGFGDKQAWTARGNRALVLHLSGGAQIYVGAEHPERLAERLRSAGSRRWDPVTSA